MAVGSAVRPGSCWSFACTAPVPWLWTLLWLWGGSFTCPMSCLKGSCHHKVPFALRLADEPSPVARSRVDGRWEAPGFKSTGCVVYTPPVSCLDSHWLWHVIQKYSAARGFSWEGFALPWLWAFLALVNSVPSGCCSDQLYPTVETAQASLSNLIISSDWKAFGLLWHEMEVFRPQSTKGQLLGTRFCWLCEALLYRL